MLTLQVVPVKPTGHAQRKLLKRSVQVPPFRQGERSHSSNSVSQVGPVYPGWQTQLKASTPSWQERERSGSHGELRQSSMFSSH